MLKSIIIAIFVLVLTLLLYLFGKDIQRVDIPRHVHLQPAKFEIVAEVPFDDSRFQIPLKAVYYRERNRK